LTNVRSRFNDWMFKVLFFLVPFLFVPLLCGRVSAEITDVSGNDVTVTAEFVDATGSDKTKITYDGNAHSGMTLIFTADGSALNPIEGTDYEVSWVQTKVGESNPMSTLDFTSAGTLRGTITTKSGSTFPTADQTETVTLTIEPKSLTDNLITVDPIANVTYDGADKTPTVTVKDDSNTLTAGTDYTVEYKDASGNTLTAGQILNAQTVTVTITGKGNYTDAIAETFNIAAKSLTDNSITVDPILDVTYDGADKTPTVTVKDGSTPLNVGTDYTVEYKDASGNALNGEIKNAQTVTVIVTGQGNYTGAITETFNITAKTLTEEMVPNIENVTYDGTDKTPTVTVKDGSTPLNVGTDYEVKYYKEDDTTELTSGQIIDAQKVKVKITGKGNYSGEITKDFTIQPVELKSDYYNNIADQTYTGSEIKPTITSIDGKEVTDSKDGTIAYTNNINVGTATVTITGKGNATGIAEKTFKIVAKPLTDNSITVTGLSDQSYSGTAKEPAVVVKDGANVLTENTHYTVSYESNTNVGTAKVTITGKGNYTGSKTVNFEIIPGSVAFENLSASNIVYGQTLSESKITGTAKDPAGNKVEGTFSFADPSFKPELADIANPKGFTQEVEIKFVSSDGNYEGTDNIQLEVQYWGKPVLNDGIMNWVDSNGTTSVQVKESGISWLKEDSDESSAWYGIENPLDSTNKPVFTPGSRFWVRWLNKSDSDWNEYYDKIDNDYKAQVDNNQLWIFLTGVTAPDGTEYKNFGTTANLYIQIGADWDERDIKSVCVLDAKDEAVDSSFIESNSLTNCPVDGKLAKLSLTHFSVYGVAPYDSKSSGSNSDDYLSDLAKELGLDTYSTGSSSKGTSSSGTTSSSGLSSLYKTTGETDEENAYLIPMLLPILLFVLIYEKKRLNKIL